MDFKHIISFMTIAAGFAMNSFGQAKTDFDHYNDWRFETYRVASTNNGDDVRLHFDMTPPLHGPWLANPGATTMSVAFQSRCNCGAAIEYREKGGEKWIRKWRTRYGLVDYADDLHFFHLKNLKPGTEYEYRFAIASDKYQNAYSTTVVGDKIWSFRTLDPKRGKFKAFVSTDLHGGARLFLDYLYERTGAEDADFYIYLGDNCNDCMSQPDFYVTTGWLDDTVALWGSYKPTVALRGNHDCWGYNAVNGWARWYERDDGKAYYSFRQGDALFIAFDIPRPYHGTEANKEGTVDYIEEEKAWFAALKKTPDWKETKWHIGMCHYGTRCATAFVDGWRFRDEFSAMLNGDDGSEPIDLMLCGDAHWYLRNLAGSKEYFHNPKYDRPRKDGQPWVFKPNSSADTNKVWRFAEVCNCVSSAAILEIDGKTLKYTDCDYRQENQPPLDEFLLTK